MIRFEKVIGRSADISAARSGIVKTTPNFPAGFFRRAAGPAFLF
jgi:hypothetical protein